MKQDNATYTHKVELRRYALTLFDHKPTVMEAYGGTGKLFDACYAHLPQGTVFEQDKRKVSILAQQRPTWAVYEADCVAALEAGAGAHLSVDLLDLDPYGGCWDALTAFFTSERPFARRMVLVVNDGLRESLEMQYGWRIEALRQAVERHGNNLHPIYLEVCREMVEATAARAGYQTRRFHGYYCGKRGKMTHFLAVLEQG